MVRMHNMRLYDPNQTHGQPYYTWKMNDDMKKEKGWFGNAIRRRATVECAAKCEFGLVEFHKELMINVERVQKVRAYLLRLPPHRANAAYGTVGRGRRIEAGLWPRQRIV